MTVVVTGGLRVPGIMHSPRHISTHRNVTTPTVTSDFLPTIMDILGVKTDNPGWVMDGMSLLPYIGAKEDLPRPRPIGVSWSGGAAIIDNDWKLMTKPSKGQCDYQPPYSTMKKLDDHYLFNLNDDYHELYDKKVSDPDRLSSMMTMLTDFQDSIKKSQLTETGCGKTLSMST